MNEPRCGNKDFPAKDEEDVLDVELTTTSTLATPNCLFPGNLCEHLLLRRKRFVRQGSRWSVKDLTYKISKYPDGGRLNREQVDDIIRRAFSLWEEHTDLKFTQQTTGNVHIDIRFESGEHGDG